MPLILIELNKLKSDAVCFFSMVFLSSSLLSSYFLKTTLLDLTADHSKYNTRGEYLNY